MAMPVFAMSCFKLPITTCENLSSAMADFWWSSCEHGRKVHWLSWEKLCLPKNKGGLGFREIGLFNQALLAKQAWRILQNPDCLLGKILKSRYFPKSEFLTAPIGTRPSYAWRSICHGRDLMVKGLEKKVGNGSSLKVWIDPWIEDEDGKRAPLRKNYFFNVNLNVSELIDRRLGDWNQTTLEDLFVPGDILLIKRIRPAVLQDDFYIWKFNKSGDFSVKSAYWLASQDVQSQARMEADALPSTNDLKSQVWDLQTDPKIKVFLWKVLCGAMPVAVALNGRGMKVDDRCQNCGMDGESLLHVLFTCSLSRQVWAMAEVPCPEFGFHNGSVFSNFHHLLSNRRNLLWPMEWRKIFPWILWRLWTNRNSLLFEGKIFSAMETVEKIREDCLEWNVAQVVETEEGTNVEITEIEANAQVRKRDVVKWLPPPSGWLKCNLGASWSKRNKLAGCAWVVRDEKGVALFHSRRAFRNIKTVQDANFLCLLWGIECMIHHRVGKVIFAIQESSLVGAVNRPVAWPSFRFQTQEIQRLLGYVLEWKVLLEPVSANRGAVLIAQSVTNDVRFQSYVATGFPSWLKGVFDDERILSSF